MQIYLTLVLHCRDVIEYVEVPGHVNSNLQGLELYKSMIGDTEFGYCQEWMGADPENEDLSGLLEYVYKWKDSTWVFIGEEISLVMNVGKHVCVDTYNVEECDSLNYVRKVESF